MNLINPNLRSVIRPTTFIKSDKLNEHLGLEITIAAETFQRTGSFKFRAAYNLAASVENKAILTASSGNFGQGLAFACRLLGKKCTVVMPLSSAKVKIDAVRNFGAEVDLIDTKIINRNQRVSELAADMPEAYIASAYDDDYVIAGNSTLGEELAKENFDVIIAPVGGGGLISGIIQGLARCNAQTRVFAAEPLLANDGARSFRAGKLIPNEKEPLTIADGARTISLGNRNWQFISGGVEDFIEVEEAEIKDALRKLFELSNLKAEPTGSLSLAAAAKNREMFAGKKICIVVSGGNVDPEIYRSLISE
jgi:threonine dehydratase